jgi:AraC-like DNA-binding protein
MPRHARSAKPLLRRPESYTWPALPGWPGLVTPIFGYLFDELELCVALWITGDFWHPIHFVTSINRFEFDRGVGARRWAYNARCFDEVARQKRIVRGQHAGFCDLFVPVRDAAGDGGVLVAGPFATARPTSAEVLGRWLDITGSAGRLSDPAFSQYLAMTLSTVTLEGPLAPMLERFMTCFAALATGQGDAAALASEGEVLRAELSHVREAEQMWEAARGLVDEATSEAWPSHAEMVMSRLGALRVPDHAVVGLLVGRRNEIDPVDEVLRRDALQRACVGLAREESNLCGRVGDHGVAFLVDTGGSPSRVRARLSDVATRAARLARAHGLTLSCGTSHAAGAQSLPTRYRAALWAAEKALSQGAPILHGEPRPEGSEQHLRRLRMGLAQGAPPSAKLLSPRFDRYAEAVLVHCGYRLEAVRAELEAGLERLAEPLVATGVLDLRSFDDLCGAMRRRSEAVRTVHELLGSYRAIVVDLEAAAQSSVAARRERGTRRARTFMVEHVSEPLTLARVAHAAGFAPGYFSRLFKKEEGVTFERYLSRLRVERGKKMLRETSLSVEEIRKLCGFCTRNYFHHVFKARVGMTPLAYRGGG